MKPSLRSILFLAAAALFLNVCSGGSSSSDRYIPPDATLDGLVPYPVPVKDVQFTHCKHYALYDSAVAPATLPGVDIVRKEVVSTLIKTLGAPKWTFGLGREELEAKLGSSAVTEAEQRLGEYYRGMFDHPATDAALRQMIQSFPQWADVDTESAQDFGHLRIEAITLSKAEATDENRDGDFETPQTLITLMMSLPSATTLTPADPLPGCATLLSDTAAMAAYAETSAVDFVAPGNAQWQYRLMLAAHFYVTNYDTLEDLGQGYLTLAQVNAAARDFGLIVHLLDNIHTLDIPSSALSVSFVAAPALQEQTLNVIAGRARTVDDVACLRSVDSWLAGASVIFPEITPAVLQGTAQPARLVDTYNEVFDALDGVAGETGISCLHDADGRILQVGDDLACDAPSGPITLEEPGPQAPGGYRVVTPYSRRSFGNIVVQRIESQAGKMRQCAAAATATGGSSELISLNPQIKDPAWWMCTNGGLCSDRFGRGIRVCLSEVVVHQQVGDYWNIHWTQDPWKANWQTTIRGGAYVVRAAAAYYTGGGRWVGPVLEMADFAADLIDKLTDTKVCGYSLKALKGVAGIWKLAKAMPDERKAMIKNAGYSLAIDMLVDLCAQAIQVTAVGWQDYSNGSHCVCGFEFRHPNYCS